MSRSVVTAIVRYLGISVVLVGSGGPVSSVIARYYGRPAARRFRLGMTSALAAQQVLVGFAVVTDGGRGRSEQGHQLSVVDVMTLSRGWAASLLAGLLASGIRDRRGMAGWMGWIALLYGAIVCDWLDGPIARHRGTSELGALLDREADSWLTLCTAIGAVGWGNLPVMVASAPLLRYVLLFDALRSTPYSTLHTHESPWVRRLGIMQMLTFIAALAPFRGRATWRLVHLVAPFQAPVQICGLVVLRRRIPRT